MPIKKKRKSKVVQLRNSVMQVINTTVAGALQVEPEKVTNSTALNYFDAMAVTYDLHKKYPSVSFPEDKFDKYCRVSTLGNYVVAVLSKAKHK